MQYRLYITDPFGNTTTSVINEQKGLVTSVTDPYNVVTDYTYDANNDRLTSVTSGDSEVTYGYEINGNLSSIRHSAMFGETVGYYFDYDELGRRTSTYVGDQELIGHIYDEYSGNVVQDAYSTGFTKQYSYDNLDNLTKVCYNNVEKFNWSYDYMGRVGLHNDLENNQEFRYTYDSKGRVESVVSKPTATGFSKSTFKNTFNAKDQLEAVSRKIGGTTLNATYTYSNGGRLLKEQYTNNSTLTYQYDDLGRVKQKTVGTSENSAALQTNYTFSTTTNSQTTARVATESITTPDFLAAYEYQYDKNGNISQIEVDYGLHTDEFEYDDLNQLTRAVVDDVGYGYEYDMAGNIVSKSGGIDEEYIEFLYTDENWKDLLTYYGEQEITYDQIGNPIDYRDGMYFTWQGRRLATASANGNSLSFKYNSDGIRTQKTVNGVTTYFTLDGSKIISQKTGDTEIFFEYDATGNVATMIYNGNTYHYIRNLMGEIVGLVDDEGILVARYYYDPWGEITGADSFTSQNIAGINPFRYKGYYYDSELGFYYLNSRYYDPETSRFINADDTRLLGKKHESLKQYNMYTYCWNDPINMTDPTGKFPLKYLVLAVGITLILINEIVKEYNYSNNQLEQNKLPNDYLEEQNDYPYMMMGFWGADHNGCGWIAVYNAMKLLGEEASAADIIRHFDKFGNTIIYGAFGANPFAVTSYFVEQEIFVMYSAIPFVMPPDIEEVAQGARACILFYAHSHGAHYAALQWNGSSYDVYNDWYSGCVSIDDYMNMAVGTFITIWCLY